MAMRTEHLDEIGDTLFAVAMAGAIGLGAANLAVQVNKERATFDSIANGQKFGQAVTAPTPADVRTIPSDEPASQLNY
jgi:hypothetical protein